MKLRQLYRNFLAMLIRYYRWKSDPKNQELIYKIEMHNHMKLL